MVNLPLSLGQYCLGLVSILAFMSSSIKLFGQAFTAITVHKETTSTLFNLICALTLCIPFVNYIPSFENGVDTDQHRSAEPADHNPLNTVFHLHNELLMFMYMVKP